IFYKDILNILMGRDIEYFYDFEKSLLDLKHHINNRIIIDKIKILYELKNNIIYNVNNNLVLDKLFIRFEEVEND
ncbi:MAG TPA: hypothetical protein GX747_01955, partial [Tenericutes bacterium]|nr:hypothetical protein [Mycoplasmatota bacterium]